MTPEQLIKDCEELALFQEFTNSTLDGITTEIGFQLGHLGIYTSGALRVLADEIDRRNSIDPPDTINPEQQPDSGESG